jgi:REP element-mobilizing transposase RayT
VDGAMPGLEASARDAMTGESVRLTPSQADALVEQFEDTARHRGWVILAGAVMSNHVHLVVGMSGDRRRRRYSAISRLGVPVG